MKTLTLKLSLVAVLVGIFGCSNQFRTGPVDDGAYIIEQLNSLTATSSSNEIAQFKNLASLPGAALYYSDSPTYGPVVSVASLFDYTFWGRPDLWYTGIEEVKVIFVDVYTSQGRQAGLLMSIKEAGKNAEVKAFVSTRAVEIDGDEYVAVLGAGGSENLVLSTMYIDEDGELENIIRMEAYGFDSSGNEKFIGQFSTLVGYQL